MNKIHILCRWFGHKFQLIDHKPLGLRYLIYGFCERCGSGCATVIPPIAKAAEPVAGPLSEG